MRDIYRERHAAFHEAAGRLLGGLLESRRSVAGFHVAGSFIARDLDEEEVRARAEAAGILVSPIGRFCIEPVETRGLVLGVSAIEPRAIRKGVELLAGVLEQAAGGKPQ
jgi:GntR family transcriptional regulator/MocR family aminotransferase